VIGIRVTVSNPPRVHDILLSSFILGFALGSRIMFTSNAYDFCLHYTDLIRILELLPLETQTV
jgi:hypothetical protein